MATVVNVRARGVREHRFFFVSACVMAATIVAGFSLQWLMGRSTLRAPLHVHIHAWLFMGWTAFYVFQTHLIRSEEHTSELQSLMRISYAVFCLKKKTNTQHIYDKKCYTQ